MYLQRFAAFSATEKRNLHENLFSHEDLKDGRITSWTKIESLTAFATSIELYTAFILTESF